MNDNIKKVSVSFFVKVSVSFAIFIIIIAITGNVLAIENKNKSVMNKSLDYNRPGLNSNSTELKASVSLHGEKTDVILGENIEIKLSAVNLITNPVMHVQVILIPPSGMSVTSSEFSKSGAGQFTTNYDLSPGDGKDIEIKIRANQIGNFNISGRIIYYFGNDTNIIEDFTQDLFIKVKSAPIVIKNDNSKDTNKNKIGDGYSGIAFTVIMIGLIAYMSYILIRRMKKYK